MDARAPDDVPAPVRYLTTRDALRQAQAIDDRVFREPDNRLRLDAALAWVNVFSRSVMALFRGGDVLGYALCLPLRGDAFTSALQGAGDLRDHLLPENLLRDEEAVARARAEGNGVAVRMVVHDPERRSENFRVAPPLVRQLLLAFHALRVRGVLCQTETPAEVLQMMSAGARKVREVGMTKDGARRVWALVPEEAMVPAPPGLGAILRRLWTDDGAGLAYPLTPAEARVADLGALSYDDARVGAFLGVAPAAVGHVWEDILRKVRDAHPGDAAHVTRGFVLARYRWPLGGGRPA
jgi:hypothetical protein